MPHVYLAAIEENRSDEPVLVPADVEDRELAHLIGMGEHGPAAQGSLLSSLRLP